MNKTMNNVTYVHDLSLVWKESGHAKSPQCPCRPRIERVNPARNDFIVYHLPEGTYDEGESA